MNIVLAGPAARRTYTTAEVSAMTGLPVRTIQSYVERGLIRSLRLGRHVLVPAEEIDRLLTPSIPSGAAAPSDGGAR